MSRKKVLIVDDSALMRTLLEAILSEAPDLEVVGAAPDPHIAREMIKRLNPDVITLDIEMPKMDGLTFLSKIMTLRPTPVVMISTLTEERADATLQALELGAVDFVAKPTASLVQSLTAMGAEIIEKVRHAANVRVRPSPSRSLTASANPLAAPEQLIAIGASTGGVTAVTDILSVLPADLPPILIVQHMPREFTGSFARRLDGKCAMNVCEVEDGMRLETGHAYIAPGDFHLRVKKVPGGFRAVLGNDEKISGHRPSVDVLFSSVAEMAGSKAAGIILTGMGKDGAQGLLQMRQAGARTIGQDEATSTVYGMCGAAHAIGAVERQLPLPRIAQGLLDALSQIR